MGASPRSFSFLLVLASACSSATSYNDQIAPVLEPYSEGDFATAAKVMEQDCRSYWEVEKDPEKGSVHYGNDAVVWNLERGKVLLDAGLYLESYSAFEDAELILNQDFSERALVSARDLAAEAGSTLTNQKSLPYKGYVSDRVLLNAYKALAALGADDPERALAEVRRAEIAYDEARRVLDLDLEDADQTASGQGLLVDEAVFAKASEQEDGSLEGAETLPSFYRDFVNPFSLLVIGIVRQVARNGVEDPEVVFRNLCSMFPGNPSLQEEWSRSRSRRGPARHVYLLFEDGIGPHLYSEEMVVPYGFIRSEVPGVNDLLATAFMAVPVLKPGTTTGHHLLVTDSSGRELAQTRPVADMETLARYEQEIRLPKVLIREAVRVVVQEVTSHAAAEAVNDQGATAQVGVAVAGLIFKAVMNQADDRFWRTLPAEYAFACFDAPADGQVTLASATGASSMVVQVPPDSNSIVRVRSVRSGLMNVQVVDLAGLRNPRVSP